MADQNTLIQKRGRVKGSITRIKSFADSLTEQTTHDDITVRLDQLNEAWTEFCDIEDNLLQFEDQVSDMVEYETKYFQAKAKLLQASRTTRPVDQQPNPAGDLNSTLSNLLHQQHSIYGSGETSQTTRLPRLSIPYFSGDYKEWTSFQDLFETSVHNSTSLSPSQKFQYLKGLLKGNAASLIRHLTINDANYEEAWVKLKERFNKKSQIVTTFIKAFLEQPQLHQSSVKSLRSMCDLNDEVIRGIRALGANAEKRDPWLIHIALTKVDPDTREAWSREVNNNEFPLFEDFLKFLAKRCDALETCAALTKRPSVGVKTLHVVSKDNSSDCPRCTLKHQLFYCKAFIADSPQVRRSLVLSRNLCFNCLSQGHSVRHCRSKVKCKICKANHHSLLHLSTNTERTSASTIATQSKDSASTIRGSDLEGNHPSTSVNNTGCSSINDKPSSTHRGSSINPSHDEQSPFTSLNTCVLEQPSLSTSANGTETSLPTASLPTALVQIRDSQGIPQTCRMVLDCGSEVSLISENCAQRLGLKRQNARLIINGLSETEIDVTKGKMQLKISSRWNDQKYIDIVAFVMKKLTSLIPKEKSPIPHWLKTSNLQLADPYFFQPSSVDIILGAYSVFECLQAGQRRASTGNHIAQETIFGWVVLSKKLLDDGRLTNFHSALTLDLDKSLTRFWEIEAISESKTLTEEEKGCEDNFRATHTRDATGRYMVSLPFKTDVDPLGDSKRNALTRLYAMERRFSKDSVFKAQYIKFMREYEDLGHMEVIPNQEVEIEPHLSFYLPHHAVFKRDPEPKIRVVFDGSCKSSSGISLNDKLMVGPTMQRDLISILINFRKFKVAFSADLEKMYRQVVVSPAHRNFQRIVWRENSSTAVKHYRLKTVTYGTASAPYLAIRVLMQIGEDSKEKFPEASSIIHNSFYVDDLLSGADSLDDAIRRKDELTSLLHDAGFNLTKWKSNITDLVTEGLSSQITQQCESVTIKDGNEVTKVLGIQWDPQDDTFTYKLSTFNQNTYSKRTILSDASKVFDPLGLLAPIIIVIKIMLQQLWLSQLDWDDPLPERITHKWDVFKNEIPEIERLRIPRRISFSLSNIQLHGFSDASEQAYGAVIYCRSIGEDGNVHTRIIAAKSKVAPLKQVSLPRLELCGALLLTRLMEKVTTALSMKTYEIYAWTDSAVVLAWLSDCPRRWKTFIGNRTGEILNSIPRSRWKHVPSSENPADIISRGVSPKELVNSEIWWNGPKWLRTEQCSWPSTVSQDIDAECKTEERSKFLTCFQETSIDEFTSWVAKVSSFSKFIRILAYIYRFYQNCKQSGSSRIKASLSASELARARIICFKGVQRTCFAEELSDIITKRTVSNRSKLCNLTPFVDDDGLLRVGGRIQKSGYNYNAQHPIILPKHHPVSNLLIREMHQIYLHPGTTLLMGLVRQRFWIIGMRSIASTVTRKCTTCIRHRAANMSQLMGNLPAERVTVSRPFSKVGIDYAGPVFLTWRSGRGNKAFKGYIALFICLATRAIHLELASSLNTETFIACLRRFISRRGAPSHIFCDNGTNFVGAKSHLNKLYEHVRSYENNSLTLDFLSQNQIAWQFIPPGSPHFGGIWEAGVKSVKWHLRRVLGETTLSYEEMCTLLCQVEAVVNSRPYSALSSDPEDLDALTPGHFLIGAPPTTLPEANLTEHNLTLLSRWKRLQSMLQSFWRRWRCEYITSLQQRSKWRSPENNLIPGDLVLLKGENLPPSQWMMGRVITCHPGSDGLVRVVTIKTRRGTFDRSVTKLVKLPVG